MDFGPLRRRAVSLVAAYAVALQALISAFVPVAFAASADPFAVLCSHSDTDRPGHPAQRDLPCAAICAAMGHGVAGAVPADVVTAITVPHVVIAVIPPIHWVPPHIAFSDTHAPRGPPLA